MKKINILHFLLIGAFVLSCGKDDNTTPILRSSAAELLQLEVMHDGVTYGTTINATSVLLSNALPFATTEVTLKTIGVSPNATADKKVGDSFQVDQRPVTIHVTAEDGSTTKRYSLNLETAPQSAIIKPFGVNLAGAEFGYPNFPGIYNTHYTYPTAEELDYYNSKGLTLVRMPFSWERIQPVLNGNLDNTELNRITEFLVSAQSKNMKVILDLHNYGRYYTNGNDEIIGSNRVSIADIRDMWTKLSSELKDIDAIWGYGIMNEPHDMLASTPWSVIAQEIINGIRESDPETTIIVGGDGWSSAELWPQFSDNLKNLTDSSDNMIFEAHVYFDNDSSGRYDENYESEGAYAERGVDRVTPFLNWLETNNLKGFIGEYGVPDDDVRWLTVLDTMLAHLKSKGVNGTYWAGGPWWGDYILSIEPANGNDKPQMQIVEKYRFAD